MQCLCLWLQVALTSSCKRSACCCLRPVFYNCNLTDVVIARKLNSSSAQREQDLVDLRDQVRASRARGHPDEFAKHLDDLKETDLQKQMESGDIHPEECTEAAYKLTKMRRKQDRLAQKILREVEDSFDSDGTKRSRRSSTESSSDFEWSAPEGTFQKSNCMRLLDAGHSWREVRRMTEQQVAELCEVMDDRAAEQHDPQHTRKGSMGVFRERDGMAHEDCRMRHLMGEEKRREFWVEREQEKQEHDANVKVLREWQSQMDHNLQMELARLHQLEQCRREKHLNEHGITHHLHHFQCRADGQSAASEVYPQS